jgi:hypothetical protein
MIRVISSPSSSTIGLETLIFASGDTGGRCYLPGDGARALGGLG